MVATDTEEDKHSDEPTRVNNNITMMISMTSKKCSRKRDRILRCRCLRTGSTSSHLRCGHQIGCDFICHRRRYRYIGE
jgi:hypothetical protein